jgi:peptidoglycan/LPS O-acetylase OafA/YrhL
VFIVLSGFVLARPFATNFDRWGGPGEFMIRRFRRIYPAYGVVLILCALGIAFFPLLGYDGTTRWSIALPANTNSFLLHLGLVHNLNKIEMFRFNPPMWSMGLEWQFYAFFAFVVIPLWKSKQWLILVICSTYLGVWIRGVMPQYSALLLCFLVGVYISTLSAESRIRRHVASPIALILPTIFLLLTKPDGGSFRLIAAGLVCASLIGALQNATHDSLMTRCLTAKPSLYLGRSSYSLYLIHFPILSVVHGAAIAGNYSPTMAFLSTLLLGTSISLVAAHYLSKFVEYRFVR